MSQGPRLQVEKAQTDDSTQDLNVIFDEQSGSIAIDYSPYFKRIAEALEKISDNTTRMKELAEGTGVNIKGPYEWLSMAAIYRVFVEQGADFNSLKSQLESLPKENGFE